MRMILNKFGAGSACRSGMASHLDDAFRCTEHCCIELNGIEHSQLDGMNCIAVKFHSMESIARIFGDHLLYPGELICQFKTRAYVSHSGSKHPILPGTRSSSLKAKWMRALLIKNSVTGWNRPAEWPFGQPFRGFSERLLQCRRAGLLNFSVQSSQWKVIQAMNEIHLREVYSARRTVRSTQWNEHRRSSKHFVKSECSWNQRKPWPVNWRWFPHLKYERMNLNGQHSATSAFGDSDWPLDAICIALGCQHSGFFFGCVRDKCLINTVYEYSTTRNKAIRTQAIGICLDISRRWESEQ